MKTQENQIVKVSEPIFKKITLINAGKDGLKLNYSIGSFSSIGEETERPIQKELDDLFNKLKRHLLIAVGNCNWDCESVFEMLKSRTTITGIT